MQQKNMIIWCMLTQTWSACTNIIFCYFRPFFAFFALLLTPKMNIWKKLKKAPEHIILLHMCTINQDHITYYSWDMKFNKHNFFVILGNFLLFTPPPPNTLKNENIKNEKYPGDIIILRKCTKKSWSYVTLFLRYGTCRM